MLGLVLAPYCCNITLQSCDMSHTVQKVWIHLAILHGIVTIDGAERRAPPGQLDLAGDLRTRTPLFHPARHAGRLKRESGHARQTRTTRTEIVRYLSEAFSQSSRTMAVLTAHHNRFRAICARPRGEEAARKGDNIYVS
jgi:hypothetical protein